MLKEQMKNEKWKMKNGKLSFVFGVRELRDVFYVDELQKWSESNSFDYEIYCSRATLPLPEKHHE
jgi:sulfite reductase alpha subunit-like flavoprotein